MEDSSNLNNVHTSDCAEEVETSSVHIEIEKPKVIQENLSINSSKLLPCNEANSTTNIESETYQTYRCDIEAGTPYYQQRQVGHQPVYVAGYPPPPPPGNAARSPVYQQGNVRRYSSNDIIFNNMFTDTAIRNQFIRKVYAILTIQLLFLFGFVALCVIDSDVKKFVQHNVFILILAYFIEIVCLYALSCFQCSRRDFPINFILLIFFTVSSSYLLGFYASRMSVEIVMMSIGLTAGVCLLISIFACQTSIDITGCGMILCILLFITMIVGMVWIVMAIMGYHVRVLLLIYAAMIAFVFSLYLMYDTQMIMGGRRFELSPEEYIYGVLSLYIDIYQIFWAILTLCYER